MESGIVRLQAGAGGAAKTPLTKVRPLNVQPIFLSQLAFCPHCNGSEMIYFDPDL